MDLNLHAVLFSEKDFKSNFSFSGNFVPVGQFFSGQPLNFLQIGSRKWGVGVKWLEVRRLGKMAARSDAARQAPPGRPGLQHITIRPPSDATPPRHCRFSALPPYSEKDFKSHFPLSGNFVPVGQFFSGKPLNCLQIGSRKWGVGVKWLGPRRLGKMAARSDAARQRPPGHPGLQHTLVRPPSDATPPRYCRLRGQPDYRGKRFSGKKRPVKRNTFGGKETIN